MHGLRMVGLLILLVFAIAPTCFAQCGEPNANSHYGINFHAPSGTTLINLADEAKNAGIGWIRVDFEWKIIETSQDQWSWSRYDSIVAAANSRGLLIYGGMGGTPLWATDGAETVGVPRNPADWYDFCYKVAQRYDGKHGKGFINYWGMWNEPDRGDFWSGNRQQYIDIILKNGADGIHAGNPDAKACGPDLSPGSGWDTWLRDCIQQAGSKLDVVTQHKYEDSYAQVTSWLDSDVKGLLQDTGWYGKPFWLTEVGWQSTEVGETNQANYYSGLLNDWCTGISSRNWMHRIFFYELADDPTNWPDLS